MRIVFLFYERRQHQNILQHKLHQFSLVLLLDLIYYIYCILSLWYCYASFIFGLIGDNCSWGRRQDKQGWLQNPATQDTRCITNIKQKHTYHIIDADFEGQKFIISDRLHCIRNFLQLINNTFISVS